MYKHYHCQEYPTYHFTFTGMKGALTFKVTVLRGLDSMLIVDLLVGQCLTLIPLVSVEKSSGKKRKASCMSAGAQKMMFLPDKYEEEEEKQGRQLKEEGFFLCKIMTIDQVPNGRRSDITVQML